MISREYGGAKRTIWSLFGAQFGEEFGEVLKLTIRPMTACTWPNRFWKPGRGRNGSKLEKLRNEQVRPLLSTSAVTAKRKVVTYRKQASRMASFGAVRYDREPLSNPYQTHDLCPRPDLADKTSATSSPKIYAASIATTLPSRSVLISRIGGWPKSRLYSRLNWLTLSYPTS
jgi:hypothetical protein